MLVFILIILASVPFALSGCSSIFHNAFEKAASDHYPRPDQVEYLYTIDDIVLRGDFVNDDGVPYTIEPITSIHNEDFAIFFRKKTISNSDWIILDLHYAKHESGETTYSRRILSNFVHWTQHKSTGAMLDLTHVGEVRYFVHLYPFSSATLELAGIEAQQRPVFGLSGTEAIRSLKIEGQPVTEVIETKLDYDIVYFWYFENLLTEKSPVETVHTSDPDNPAYINFNNGEMLITMN